MRRKYSILLDEDKNKTIKCHVDKNQVTSGRYYQDYDIKIH